jgi:acyl-ACP thioesterase
MFDMAPRPGAGRLFHGERLVRLGDCSPGGRMRLDAVARYLQDVSDDDTRDAGLAQMTWVVRRTVIDVDEFPTYLSPVRFSTWCSGIGSRWAERRVDVTSGDGGVVRSATLWVHLDAETQRPLAPPLEFAAVFDEAAAGRSVSSRLALGGPPTDINFAPWPLRVADFDVMNHVNNAVAFELVEEVLSVRRDLRAPLRVEVEYRLPIERGAVISYGGSDAAGGHEGWIVDADGRCLVAVRIASREQRHPSAG